MSQATELGENDSFSDYSTKEYSYTYKGVEVSGTYPLTANDLEKMYNEALNPLVGSNSVTTSESTFTIFGADSGGSYLSVIPPMYKTYTNKTEKAIADLITAAVINKAPYSSRIKQTTFGAWVIARISVWTNGIKPTYVGSWVSSSWDNYYGERRYKQTLVHYNKSNYTDIKSIQYYDVYG